MIIRTLKSIVGFLRRFMYSSRDLRMEFWWCLVWYSFFGGTTFYYFNLWLAEIEADDLDSETCKWINVFIKGTCVFGIIRIVFDPIAVIIDISVKLLQEEEERGYVDPDAFNPMQSLGIWCTLFIAYMNIMRWMTWAWIMSGVWILVYYSLLRCHQGTILLEFTSVMLLCMSVLGFFLSTACDFLSWVIDRNSDQANEMTQIRNANIHNYLTNHPANLEVPGVIRPSSNSRGLNLRQLKDHSWCFVIPPPTPTPSPALDQKNDDIELPGECSICQEALVVGNFACRLRCGHSFHQNCVAAWAAIKPTCPNCCRPVIEPA